MNWGRWASSVVLLTVACADKVAMDARFEVPAAYTTGRSVRVTYTLQNQTPHQISDVELHFHVPDRVNSQQALRSVHVSHAATFRPGQARIKVDLPPLGTRVIRVDYQVAQSGTRVVSPVGRGEWLASTPVIQVDNAAIAAKARGLRTDDTVATARALFEFAAGHVHAGPFDSVDRGAVYALEQQQGDCSEFSALLVALLRAAGIPARRVSGFVCADSCRDGLYHTWVEFHDGETWHPVDAQYHRFDELTASYLALEIDEERALPPLRGQHRFALVVPGGAAEQVRVETHWTVD